jgi:hypothetical protein
MKQFFIASLMLIPLFFVAGCADSAKWMGATPAIDSISPDSSGVPTTMPSSGTPTNVTWYSLVTMYQVDGDGNVINHTPEDHWWQLDLLDNIEQDQYYNVLDVSKLLYLTESDLAKLYDNENGVKSQPSDANTQISQVVGSNNFLLTPATTCLFDSNTGIGTIELAVSGAFTQYKISGATIDSIRPGLDTTSSFIITSLPDKFNLPTGTYLLTLTLPKSSLTSAKPITIDANSIATTGGDINGNSIGTVSLNGGNIDQTITIYPNLITNPASSTPPPTTDPAPSPANPIAPAAIAATSQPSQPEQNPDSAGTTGSGASNGTPPQTDLTTWSPAVCLTDDQGDGTIELVVSGSDAQCTITGGKVKSILQEGFDSTEKPFLGSISGPKISLPVGEYLLTLTNVGPDVQLMANSASTNTTSVSKSKNDVSSSTDTATLTFTVVSAPNASEEDQKAQLVRNQIIDTLMYYSKANSRIFLDRAFAQKAASDTLWNTLSAVLAGGAIATVATPPVSVGLNAVNLVGSTANNQIDKTFYEGEAFEAMEHAIHAAQAPVEQRIKAGENKSYADYSLPTALADINDYNERCSLRFGLIELEKLASDADPTSTSNTNNSTNSNGGNAQQTGAQQPTPNPTP